MVSAVHIQAEQTLAGWPARLARELNASDERARELLRQLTTAQLNWQPAPGSWSIGQCLEHLCITNEEYLAAISPALENRPDNPVTEIEPGWFGRWFLRTFVEPTPQTKRASAP